MRSTDGDPAGSAEDQAYFRELEAAFLRLRGSGTLLAADDWQLASAWRRAGVPLDLVIATMERGFARQRERRSRRGISSLRYFRAAVAAAWDERRELQAGGTRAEQRPLAVPERLAALAASLPPELPGVERLAEQIRALSGSVAEVEPLLARLDRALLERLEGGLEEAERAAIERSVERALVPLGDRIEPAERQRTAERLRVQALRRRWRLPLLSLFSPEAQEAEGD